MSAFHVYISGAPGSVEDWRAALNAPEDQLPELDEGAKEIAQRMELDEKEYARGVLSSKLSGERNLRMATTLGEEIHEILQTLDAGRYQLSAVLRNQTTKQEWQARVIAPQGVVNFEVPPEIVDELNRQEAKSKLKTIVLAAIGQRGELRNAG